MSSRKNEIISQYEDFGRVLADFGVKISNYRQRMAEKCADVNGTVEGIASVWQGNGYADFKKKMNDKIGDILSTLGRCDDLKTQLDEAARSLSEALDKLRDKN